MPFPTGQDWASYQSATPSTRDLDFVVIKVTEGTGYTNPRWKQQRDTARKAGLLVGYYHYAHGIKNLAEADFFLKTTGTLQPGEFLAFDWEDSDVSNAEKDAWIKYVQGKVPAHRVLLYCNRSYWLDGDTTSFAGDGLWIADPGAAAGSPRVQHRWSLHQYSTAGGVDHNVANFPSVATFRTWLLKSAPKPPTPAPHTLTPAKTVSLKVAIWTATHPAAEEKKYPHNWPQVYAIQHALVANKRLKSGAFEPGIFDPATKNAYEAEQKAQHFTGDDADGVPGKKSLTTLGRQHGFTVTT